jgi:uncharacterized protein YhhL (DUF1145 family)
MDFATLMHLASNLGLLWIGNNALGGIFWTVVVMCVLQKFGAPFEVCLLVGGAFLFLFSAFFLPIEITAIISVALAVVIYIALSRIAKGF